MRILRRTTRQELWELLDALAGEVAQFAPDPALTHSTEIQLKSALAQYVSYLRRLGLTPVKNLTVHVQDRLPEPGFYSYFSGSDIFILSSHAKPAYLIHEYNHAVLLRPFDGHPGQQWAYSAVEAGVANYLTADFLNSPILDFSNLDQRVPVPVKGGTNDGGTAWGSFLWALRKQLGPKRTNASDLARLGCRTADIATPRLPKEFP
jgi:hypothetical protein